MIATWAVPERCEAAVYIAALGPLMPPPAPGAPGPFALSGPGALEGLATEAGLTPVDAAEVSCPWTFPDLESALTAMLLPVRRSRRSAARGKTATRDAVAAAIEPFCRAIGWVRDRLGVPLRGHEGVGRVSGAPPAWRGIAGSGVDNGAMANRVSSRRLVGRDDELELLLELVRRAGEGDGRAALVVGEAGIGKSRLVSEFAGRARECGTLVLVGECVDLAEAELPYAPIVGALRAVVRERSELDLAKLFGAARGELARLLPELGDPGPSVQGSVGQTRLFELVLGVLSRLGQERPVALVIEDVHWADSASLDLLAFLVRNQRSERFATVDHVPLW